MYTSTQYVHVAKTDDSTTRRARDRLALILRRLLKAKAHRRGYEVSTQTKGTHILASFHRVLVLVLVLVLSRVVVDATSGWVENPKTRVSRDARGTTTRDDDARDDDSRLECDRAPFRACVRSRVEARASNRAASVEGDDDEGDARETPRGGADRNIYVISV